MVADVSRRSGRRVRATVRSPDSEGDLRAAVRRGDADDGGLELVAAELNADEGWAAAAAGCDEVHHLALPMIQTDDPDQLIVPPVTASGGCCGRRATRVLGGS